MDETCLASIPATISRWNENEEPVTTSEPIRVLADYEVPQVCLEVRGVGLYLSGLEAEILETAIRVARQSFRRR